jgi:hypothetical protein
MSFILNLISSVNITISIKNAYMGYDACAIFNHILKSNYSILVSGTPAPTTEDPSIKCKYTSHYLGYKLQQCRGSPGSLIGWLFDLLIA